MTILALRRDVFPNEELYRYFQDLMNEVEKLKYLDSFRVVGLVDGVTAPATDDARAQIYIDEADGDLKIKFADGTVKTIVVDT